MIGWGVAASHMGEVVDWRSSFLDVFSRKRTIDRERLSPTYYTSIDAVSAKDVPSGISLICLIGELSPKNPSFWRLNGEFQLKRLRAYLGTEETHQNA
jgi:hypothetical protein